LRHVKEPLRLRGSRIQGGILSAIFSPDLPSFANREAPHSNGSGLCRGLHDCAAWAPLELTEGTKSSSAQKAGVIQAYVLTGLPGRGTNLSIISVGARGGVVVEALRYKSEGLAGLIPDGVTGFFYLHNPSGRTMALGSTQSRTEMSTGNDSWEQCSCSALPSVVCSTL
jgi:hypothetical protein